MCNCMAQALENVSEHVKQNLPKHDPDSLTICYQNKVIRFDGSTNNVMLPISVNYRRLKNSGEKYRNETSDTVNLAMRHCPFCGEKFEKGDDE